MKLSIIGWIERVMVQNGTAELLQGKEIGTVLFSAQANYPDQPIVALAVTAIGSDSKISQPVPPCGSCRQAMIEAESRHNQPLRVIMQGEEGPIIISERMENLMPLTFAKDFLKRYTEFA